MTPSTSSCSMMDALPAKGKAESSTEQAVRVAAKPLKLHAAPGRGEVTLLARFLTSSVFAHPGTFRNRQIATVHDETVRGHARIGADQSNAYVLGPRWTEAKTGGNLRGAFQSTKDNTPRSQAQSWASNGLVDTILRLALQLTGPSFQSLQACGLALKKQKPLVGSPLPQDSKH